MPESTPLLVLQFAFSLAGYGAVGWWFIRPWLRAKPVRTPLAILRLRVADDLGAAWFGIAFVVPLMLVVHILIFVFLLAPREGSAQP